MNPLFAVGSKHAMKSGQVDPWLGNQCGQLGNEIQWFEDDMSGAVTVWRFELDRSCASLRPRHL